MKKLLACVALCCLVGAPACEQDAEKISPSVKAINDDPVAHLGRTVTVRGEVEEKYAPGLFRLDGPGLFGDEILVFSPDDEFVVEGDELWVHGPVRILEVVEVERELGLDLDRELEVEFASAPVLMSKDVTLRTAS